MAYSRSPRFPNLLDDHLDPGAYYISSCIQKSKESSAPFLSRLPRTTFLGGRIFTDKIYNADKAYHIPGGMSMQDKTPRFQFDTSQSDSEEDICKCASQECVCGLDDEKFKGICQSEVPRKLYKGHVPFNFLGEGQSMPSRGHQGYSILPDGRQEAFPRLRGDPVSYETRVNESTAFYRGCKWSQWTSRRADLAREATPGPADYQHEHVPSHYELCMDKFRFLKRHNTRQLRYMEMVQLRNILQRGPGPSDYYPKYPKCNDLQKIGPRAARFSEAQTLEVRPGPADHNINKAMCKGLCYAKKSIFGQKGPFGVKAERFHDQAQQSPGPGEYSPRIKKVMRDKCSSLPAFGCSAARFKANPESEDEDEMSDDCTSSNKECVLPTSSFKSKTKRFKPLIKLNSPSPEEIILPKYLKRTAAIQRLAPFQSSEGRFKPWHDWMPVHGTEITPGPGLYITREPQCVPGGLKMSRACRFSRVRHDGPPPNAYSVERGKEIVCHTFNQRLLKSVNKKDTFKWKPLVMEPRSIRSREAALLAKSIHDLSTDPNIKEFKSHKDKRDIESEIKGVNQIPRLPGEQVLLRYFLYDHEIEPC